MFRHIIKYGLSFRISNHLSDVGQTSEERSDSMFDKTRSTSLSANIGV